MIKAIIFDCFGVLTTDLLMEFTQTLPPKIMPDIHDIIHQRGAGLISRDQFVDEIAKITGRDRQDVDNITKPGGIKNEKIFDKIRDLKNEDYKIGLLSNVGSNWVREEFLTVSEQKLFDDILLSYEVNLIKPDPEIFQLTADRLKVDIKQCVLVDDIERYCEAATAEGMHAICYQNFEQFKVDLEKLLSAK